MRGIANTMGWCRECIAVVQGSWSYNHKTLIVLMSLVVVILVQNFGPLMPTIQLSHEHTVVLDKPMNVDCDYKCLTTAWVNMRTEELIQENMADYKLQMRTKALLEANAMLTEI